MILFKIYLKGKKKGTLSENEKVQLVKNIFSDKNVKNGQYTAAVDFPASVIWKEVYNTYPNVKVILTERKVPEQWWESGKETILIPSWSVYFLRVIPFFKKHSTMCMAMWDLLFDVNRDLTVNDRELAIEGYKKNSKNVRDFFKENPEDLLVYTVGSGWEPLCKFLNKPIPDVPFPRTNSKEEMKRRQNFILCFELVILFLVFFVLRKIYLLVFKKNKKPTNKIE